jgi:hypothetical protein
MSRIKTLAAAAGLTLAAAVGGAGVAQAADATPTTTVISVNGYTSDVTLQLKDGQYPADHAGVALAANVTYQSATGPKAAAGSVTFYRNGEIVQQAAKLTGCTTAFQAKYAGQAAGMDKAVQKAFAPSWSQIVTVKLVGGHCADITPAPKPSDTTSTPTVTVTTPAPAKTVVVTTPAPTKTEVVVVSAPVVATKANPVSFTG